MHAGFASNSQAGINAWTDLGGGTGYGSLVVSEADEGMWVEAPLNAAAISMLNGGLGGLVGIGAAVTSFDPVLFGALVGTEFVFVGGTTPSQLVLVPEPAGSLLLLLGGAALFIKRRRV
jgi:hypothetical protein